MANKNGFTLVELLVVVAVISITMSIGLPSFQSTIASTRLTSAANAMVSALQLARSEALKQQKTVFVIKKTKWENGWDIFVDSKVPANKKQDLPDEPTFATFDLLSSTITVPYGTGKGTYLNYVSYSANGSANSGHFIFCSSSDFRSVVISSTGRIRVDTSSNSTITYTTSGC